MTHASQPYASLAAWWRELLSFWIFKNCSKISYNFADLCGGRRWGNNFFFWTMGIKICRKAIKHKRNYVRNQEAKKPVQRCSMLPSYCGNSSYLVSRNFNNLNGLEWWRVHTKVNPILGSTIGSLLFKEANVFESIFRNSGQWAFVISSGFVAQTQVIGRRLFSVLCRDMVDRKGAPRIKQGRPTCSISRMLTLLESTWDFEVISWDMEHFCCMYSCCVDPFWIAGWPLIQA